MRSFKVFSFVLLSNVFMLTSMVCASENTLWQAVQIPPHAQELKLSLDESAKLLAGIPIATVETSGVITLKSFWRQLQNDKVWRYEKDYDGDAFMTSNKIAANRKNIAVFARKFSSQAPGKQVIYPFGGPDAIYPTLLFDFDHMVSIGLESAGSLDIKFYQADEQLYITIGSSSYTLASAIESICYSLASLPMRSYFVTDSMKTELRGGVAIAYLVQLAALGADIKDAYLHNENLSIQYSFDSGISQKKISYIKHDLSSMARINEIENLLGDQDSILFLKAAQYLLYPTNSTTFLPFISWIENRNSIKHVVQTVSGLPWKFFKPGAWQTQFYGAYLPLAMHPSFAAPHKMNVDEDLMVDFYRTLNNEQGLNAEDSQCKDWICSNNIFVKAHYSQAMAKGETPLKCSWEGALNFDIGYPCFLSRTCSANSGKEWNFKSHAKAGDHTSFLMIAKRL